LVYCSKCGAKNEDNAEVCARCGEPLLRPEETGRRSWRGEGLRSIKDRRSPSFWGIFFGLLIVLYGAIWLLSAVFPWLTWDRVWPFIMILFGIAIIVRALMRR
jgi:ribosomal protein L40E